MTADPAGWSGWRALAPLWIFTALGYAVLYQDSLLRGLAPRPMQLLRGYEPWSRLAPSKGLLEAPPILFDEVVQFAPWQSLTSERLARAEAPLWNPYQYCGAPHLGAAQPAVFSPLAWPALIPSAWAMHAGRLLGFEVAATGAFLWLAAQGLGVAAGWLGALGFAFCGFLTLWAGHPHFLSAVWLPWLFLGIDRMREGKGGFSLACWAIGLSLLGGHPETAFHLALAGAIYCLPRPGLLLRLVGASICGACLAGVSVVPFLEYLSLSSAWLQRSGASELPRALPLEGLACLLVPERWGGEPFGPFQLPTANLNELAGGFLGALLVGLALSAPRSPWTRRAWSLIGACLLLAFEPGPVGWLVARLPMLGLAYNGRLLLVVALMLSGLGAAGLEAVLVRGRRPWGLAVCLLALLLLRASPIHWICLLAGAALLLAPRPWPRGLVPGGLLLCATAPALWLARGYHGGAPLAGFWPELPIPISSASASHDRFVGLGWRAFPPEIATAYRLRDIRGYDALTPRSLEEILSRVEPWANQESRLGIFKLRALSRWNRALFDFLGVRLLYLERGMALPPDLEARPMGGGFWSVPSGGRARFVAKARWFDRESDLLDYVVSEVFDPNVPGLLGRPAPLDETAEGSVRWILDEPEHLELETQASGEGFLLLADTDFPGWSCRVDGEERPCLRANHAFRAIRLEGGKHRVEWIYRPASFRAGRLASSIFLGLMLSNSVLRYRRRSARQC